MARRDPTLVYVHGAGAQPPAADWIRIHNQILFSDRSTPQTDLAYYADLILRFDDPGRAPSVVAGVGAIPGAATAPDGPEAEALLAEPGAAEHVLRDSIHGSVGQ